MLDCRRDAGLASSASLDVLHDMAVYPQFLARSHTPGPCPEQRAHLVPVSPWICSMFVAVRSGDVRSHLKSDDCDMKMVVLAAAGQARLIFPGQVLPAV